ncbi:MAG: hypothetical protein PF689_06850 [Deltaproteobacteria bacterium]|jgi:hypothetical protein|nr:hypothetical protein [Deltaproteobacteria bacterium]
MKLNKLFFFSFLSILLLSCSPGESGTQNNDNNNNNNNQVCEDTDSDTICDVDEGSETNFDTDGDGTPDYLDLDADGDGIPDIVEAGDDDLATPPADSNGDGTPDYQSTDSDGNGIPDADEGTSDIDADGISNYADLDNDGDFINDTMEMDEDGNQVDTDGDAVPDHNDVDSDGDGIGDYHEGTDDADDDGIPNFRDTDSDGDGISDTIEGGTNGNVTKDPVDSDEDGDPDYLDVDSDNDGLADNVEDKNHNGVVDSGETDPQDSDSDDDGASDLIEVGAGTDPANSDDNPQNNGDFVFVVPYEEPQDPEVDVLDFATDLQKADLYFLVDVSGSMNIELTNLRSDMQTIISDSINQIPDLQVGIGSFLYAECTTTSRIYDHRLDIQADPVVAENTFPEYDTIYEDCGSCCSEPPRTAMYFAATGNGSSEAAADGVTTPGGVPNEANCANEPGPCPSGYFGYPCFRPGALPIIAVFTDEGFDQGGGGTPEIDSINALNDIGAKTIGIYSGTSAQTDMENFMVAQGSVDGNGDPFAFDGEDAQVSSAIVNAIEVLAHSPMDISSVAADNDDGADQFGQVDTINAVAEFIDFLEATQTGANCTSGWTMSDSNGDSYPDLFHEVTPGNPVCWNIHVKQNNTIEATEFPQVFTATIFVYGDNTTEVDSRVVYFLVPPIIEGPGVIGK